MVLQVPQVDEEDKPRGFSTNSSVVTLWPPNKDEGDVDNDDLEWDDADLMGRRKVTFVDLRMMDLRIRRRMRRRRVNDENDPIADNDDSESDNADFNFLKSYFDDDDQLKE